MYKLCTQMQSLMYESMISIVLDLMSKLEYIKVLSSAQYHVIYGLLVLGNSLMQMTYSSLQRQNVNCQKCFVNGKPTLKGKVIVDVGKTKIMISAHNAPKPIEASKFPCGVCSRSVGSNYIKCFVCGFWVHKSCSNVQSPMKLNMILIVRSVEIKYQM